MSETLKRCPFCVEEILVDAKKCKHCGSALEEGASVSVIKPYAAANYGLFLLVCPAIATALIWFWVAQMNLLQSPASTLAFILGGVIVTTALVAAMEADKVGMKSDRKKGTYSPISWFFIIAFLWLVGYPAYLYKRRHYGLPNLLAVGIAVAAIFLGSWALMSSAIEDQKEEMRGKLEGVQKSLAALGALGSSTPVQAPVQVQAQPPASPVKQPDGPTHKFVDMSVQLTKYEMCGEEAVCASFLEDGKLITLRANAFALTQESKDALTNSIARKKEVCLIGVDDEFTEFGSATAKCL